MSEISDIQNSSRFQKAILIIIIVLCIALAGTAVGVKLCITKYYESENLTAEFESPFDLEYNTETKTMEPVVYSGEITGYGPNEYLACTFSKAAYYKSTLYVKYVAYWYLYTVVYDNITYFTDWTPDWTHSTGTLFEDQNSKTIYVAYTEDTSTIVTTLELSEAEWEAVQTGTNPLEEGWEDADGIPLYEIF